MNTLRHERQLSPTTRRELGLTPKSTVYETHCALRDRIKGRWERKQMIRACGCLGGLVAKHILILNKKGKNGRSMSPELFARHAAAADSLLALA